MTDTIRSDQVFTGTVTFTKPPTLPAGTVDNDDVKAGAAIDASKLEHQFPIDNELFGESATITALTKWIHTALAAGTLQQFEAVIAVAATGGDRTVDVDLQRSRSGAAFASVLTAALQFTSADAVRTPKAASISDNTVQDGDIFRIVVTVAGSAGAQAQGLMATLWAREAAA